MKRILFWLLPIAVIAAGCSGDEIANVTAEEEETTISVDCTDLNADILVLQKIVNELGEGSTVTAYKSGTITFSSGTSVTVATSAYDFAYVNPVIGASGGYWTLDGAKTSNKVADGLAKVKVTDGVWFVSYDGGTNYSTYGDVEAGTSIPVFYAISQGSDGNVTITLANGTTLVAEAYSGGTSLTLSDSALTMAAEAGSATISVTSNASWTASSTEDWASVSPSSGNASDSAVTVTVTVTENTSEARSALIVFKADDISQALAITQAGTSTVDTNGGVIDTGDTEESDDNVKNTTFDRTITITYSGTSATVSNDVNNTVSVSGAQVTVNNTTDEAVIYKLTGSTTNGFFKIYSGRKQAIYLDGVTITNTVGAAINVQGPKANPSKGKRTFIVVEGTNTLKDGSSYSATPSTEDEKACIFSEGQIIFSGSGALKVTAQGKSGIISDDYVRVMTSPAITVSSSAGHGIRGKESVIISNGTLDVTATANMKKGINADSLVLVSGGVTTVKVSGGTAYDNDDKEYKAAAGVKADQLFQMTDGKLTITSSGAGGKGLRAGSDETVTGRVSTISGGTLTITVTGSNTNSTMDKSAKGMKVGWKTTSSKMDGALKITGGTVTVSSKASEGIECKGTIDISGGVLYATSSDDAVNSAGDMTISGGYVCAHATGNDGLDANGNLYIKSGVVYAIGANSPELAIDANTEGGKKLYVSGGTIVAIGGLEGGASLTQSCYSTASWNRSTLYGLTVGSTTYVFKTPSSAGNPLVVSGASTPTLKSGVTVSGGTSYFGSTTPMTVGGTISGGSSVSLSSYSGGNGGGQPGGGGGGGGGGGRR